MHQLPIQLGQTDFASQLPRLTKGRSPSCEPMPGRNIVVSRKLRAGLTASGFAVHSSVRCQGLVATAGADDLQSEPTAMLMFYSTFW